MTTTDSNGVIRYQSTDPVSPLHTLLNLGMQSVSDALTPVVALAVDSGWVNVVSAGAQTPNTVQVRKIGKNVVIRGAFNGVATALSSTFTTLGTIPSGYAPGYSILLGGAYSGNASLQFQISGGVISVRTFSGNSTTSVSPSFSIAGATWTVD